MCCWLGSQFHDWIDCNGVAFSIELLESRGRTFSDFWGRTFEHLPENNKMVSREGRCSIPTI